MFVRCGGDVAVCAAHRKALLFVKKEQSRPALLLVVPSGRLPADAETLAFTQERKRAQRERDFTPTPLDEGPRATPLPMGLVAPTNAR